MRRSVALPLALSAAALAALVPAVWQRHVVCALVPVACGTSAVLWSLSCSLLLAAGFCLLALAVWRALESVRLQWARTAEALRPLRALPAVAPSANLATVLRTLRLEGRTTLIACAAPVALCHGLLRPRLLLSTGALRGLSATEVEAVLRHERAHLRRRDPLRLVVARAMAAALPAVPLLGALAATLPAAQELAADRAVLAAMGGTRSPARCSRSVMRAARCADHWSRSGLSAMRSWARRATAQPPAPPPPPPQLLGEPAPRLSPSPRTLLAAGATLGLAATLAALVPLLWCVVLAPVMMGTAAGRRPARGREPL